MSEYLIQGETLTGIADAIRGKTGGTAPVAVSDMAAQIDGIQTGGGDIDALIDRSITEISSNATSIAGYTFWRCSALTTVDFPAATRINSYAFYYCSALTTVDFPAAMEMGSYTFQYCSKLTTIKFPVLTSVGDSAFQQCAGLITVDLPAATRINGYAFYYCSALTTLVLRSATVASLTNENTFRYTPIASGTGYIYVPAALIEQYKVATNWSTYAAQFRALEDYTVDGTVTGELDPAKTGT